jgi:hypothetical protein
MRLKNGSPLTLAMGIRTKVTKALQHSGQVGHIYIDGEGFSLCVTAKDERNQSPRRWDQKRRLAFCRTAQDGCDEGVCISIGRRRQPRPV